MENLIKGVESAILSNRDDIVKTIQSTPSRNFYRTLGGYLKVTSIRWIKKGPDGNFSITIREDGALTVRVYRKNKSEINITVLGEQELFAQMLKIWA